MSGTTRTTVMIDDDLLDRARELTGLETKQAVIDEALRTLVRFHEEERVREEEVRKQLQAREPVRLSQSPAQILAEERAKRFR